MWLLTGTRALAQILEEDRRQGAEDQEFERGIKGKKKSLQKSSQRRRKLPRLRFRHPHKLTGHS